MSNENQNQNQKVCQKQYISDIDAQAAMELQI